MPFAELEQVIGILRAAARGWRDEYPDLTENSNLGKPRHDAPDADRAQDSPVGAIYDASHRMIHGAAVFDGLKHCSWVFWNVEAVIGL